MSCDSCGDEAPTVEVTRIYVTPASWDTEGSATPATTTEQWCEVCRLHYPHRTVDDT